ncbi:hypothetical protein LTS17_008883 [Exophiala oligosperma]
MGRLIDPETRSRIQSTIDQKVQSGAVPPLLYLAFDHEGDVFFSHVSGTRGVESDEPMTRDTVFWVASWTKLVTTIACMQLVEKGALALDDAEQVASLAPELSKFKVIVEDDGTGNLRLEEQRKPITLRMLLSHTAGFGYAFDDVKLRRWSLPTGIDDFNADFSELLRHQLVNQPGEAFQYGVGLDWAGLIVQRVTDMTLDDYVQKHIVRPLGLEEITFLPTESMKSRLAYMHQRGPDGTSLRHTEHINRRPLLAQTAEDKERLFHMGGCGLFARPDQYFQIIASLLNNGFNKRANLQLLKPETVALMFKDQIPDKPIHTDEPWQSAKPLLANPTPIFPPPPPTPKEGSELPRDDTMGWGLSFALTLRPGATGRATGTAWWEGLPNLYWFADRASGIGGIIAAQVLPYGDKHVVRLADEVEKMIYDALRPAKI